MTDPTNSAAQRNGQQHSLEREMQTFRTNLANLLAENEGKFVLIHADQVAGIFDSWQEGVAEGYNRFDLEPFLVKQLVAVEKPIFLPREAL